ncbi:DUF962 domain-containing protein [Paraferrimonas sedimenticola]|uniref:DUF962 domain-containing protein n=1 Tax=Paraferrimonas sedimenticola TaxID=375674 RepID=A0AA37W1T3_9GAMM|nr:DUF962 domain-containing protein [Paraferrimonas sedimenticola]GLP96732.1 hypothetical protein GCM10007895_20380 [Paraferrimonas sedimenticola]
MAKFDSFWEFYPYYLSEHKDVRCRALHYVGSTLALLSLAWVILVGGLGYIWVPLLCGYGPAWAGHALFEKNKPATFSYPFYSFCGDWVMFFQAITGRLRIPA